MRIGDMHCPWHLGMTLFECKPLHEAQAGYYRHPPVDPLTGEVSADEHAISMGQMRHCDCPAPHGKKDCTAIMDNHGWIDNGVENLDGTHGITVCPEVRDAAT